jgi:uncharacterized protein YcgI (DUF1989 family)
MTPSGKDILVPAGFAGAFEVPAGGEFDVIDVAGGQIADFIAFNLEDPEERFSARAQGSGITPSVSGREAPCTRTGGAPCSR